MQQDHAPGTPTVHDFPAEEVVAALPRFAGEMTAGLLAARRDGTIPDGWTLTMEAHGFVRCVTDRGHLLSIHRSSSIDWHVLHGLRSGGFEATFADALRSAVTVASTLDRVVHGPAGERYLVETP